MLTTGCYTTYNWIYRQLYVLTIDCIDWMRWQDATSNDNIMSIIHLKIFWDCLRTVRTYSCELCLRKKISKLKKWSFWVIYGRKVAKYVGTMRYRYQYRTVHSYYIINQIVCFINFSKFLASFKKYHAMKKWHMYVRTKIHHIQTYIRTYKNSESRGGKICWFGSIILVGTVFFSNKPHIGIITENNIYIRVR